MPLTVNTGGASPSFIAAGGFVQACFHEKRATGEQHVGGNWQSAVCRGWPRQNSRKIALFSFISVFVIIFIVIVTIAIIAIIASRSLLSTATQHITRACVGGHPNYYTSLSPPSRPVQGRRCTLFYLISVLMDSGFRVFL